MYLCASVREREYLQASSSACSSFLREYSQSCPITEESNHDFGVVPVDCLVQCGVAMALNIQIDRTAAQKKTLARILGTPPHAQFRLNMRSDVNTSLSGSSSSSIYLKILLL